VGGLGFRFQVSKFKVSEVSQFSDSSGFVFSDASGKTSRTGYREIPDLAPVYCLVPPPPGSFGIIELAGDCLQNLGAQSVTGNTLIANNSASDRA
jgi:hypothetical protein